MRKTVVFAILMCTIPSAACSGTSGIRQVDEVRDALAAKTGLGNEIAPVADAAQTAAIRAERAGERGDVAEMADAIGKGTGEMLCAGSRTRGRITSRAAPSVTTNGATTTLTDMIRQMPALPNICG